MIEVATLGKADISTCGKYRWWLTRRLDGGDGRTVCFVMLNPSTADASEDDPTIRRCVSFGQRWGYSLLVVRNLFAYRATNPRELLAAKYPTGGDRGDTELMAAMNANLVVAAWGASVPFCRDRAAMRILERVPLFCLGRTKHGKPRHPLYVRGDRKLEAFGLTPTERTDG